MWLQLISRRGAPDPTRRQREPALRWERPHAVRAMRDRLALSLFLALVLAGGLLAPAAAAYPSYEPPSRPAEATAISALTLTSTAPTVWGEPTTFTAVTTGARPVGFLWAFGDGATVEIAPGPRATVIVSHTYSTPGTYVASVTAGNQLGALTVDTTVDVDAPTSVDLVEFGRPVTGNFWALWSLAMLGISVLSVLGLAIMWRRGWLFTRRR